MDAGQVLTIRSALISWALRESRALVLLKKQGRLFFEPQRKLSCVPSEIVSKLR